MLPFFDDLGVVGNDIFVAKETFLHGRNPGIWRPFHKRMAEPAVDFFYPRMDAVAEVNRLLRAQVTGWVSKVKIEHNSEENTRHPEPKVPSARMDSTALFRNFRHFSSH